jgi:hypothetical protein
VVKESTEEITSWEAKSTLKEGGEHQNLIHVGCWDVFPDGKTPLQHGAVREMVIRNKFRMSPSSAIDGWNRCGCEAAMAEEMDCYSIGSTLA